MIRFIKVNCFDRPSVFMNNYLNTFAMMDFPRFPGWGHLITRNGPMMGHLNSFSASGGGEFEQKFSKNSNAWGVARGGMFKLRFD